MCTNTPWYCLAQPLFPNQKQTAINRAPPCYLTLVSYTISWCPHDVQLARGYFICSVGRECKMAASHFKDLAALQTQYN